MFRFHGFAKGYMYRWELFLRGKSDEAPPAFNDYIQNAETASRDTWIAERRFVKSEPDQEC